MSDNSNGTAITVVLGGSFNPPTRAHKALMEAALEWLDEGAGITGLYVPSSGYYVERKNQKSNSASPALSEEQRHALLEAMRGPDTLVDACEYGDRTKGRTLQTLDRAAAAWPGTEVWLVLGADKIPVFRRWPTAKDILERHHVLWTARDGVNAMAQVRQDPFLSQYLDRQSAMPQPGEAENVSSTAFWAQWRAGSREAALAMLDPAVAAVFRQVMAENHKKEGV